MARDTPHLPTQPPPAPAPGPMAAWRAAPTSAPPALLAWVVAYVAVDVLVAVVQPEGVAAPWYPPLAIGVALLVRHGLAAWPLVALADLVAGVVVPGTAAVAAGADAVIVAAEAALVVVLAGRAVRHDPHDGAGVALRLLGAATVATAAAATVGAPVVSWLDDGAASWSAWRPWFLGDLTGIITVLPALLLILDRWDRRDRVWVTRWEASRVEVAVVSAAVLAGTLVAFADLASPGAPQRGLELLLLVPVVWLSARTGPLPAALLSLAVNTTAVLVVLATDHDLLATSDHLLSLQGFMVALAVSALVTAFASTGERRAGAHHRTLLDASPLAVVGLDADGLVTGWNPAATACFGWRAEEVLGRRFPLVDPDDWDAFRRRHDDVLAGRGTEGAPVTYRHRDGHRVRARLFAGRLLDAGGRPVGAIGVIEDLGDRTRLVEERDRLAAAIEQADESIVVTDASARIVYANPAVERATGYALDELLGQNPRIFQSGAHTADFYDRMWAELTSGRTWRGVLVNRRRDGTLFEEDATVSPVHDERGDLVAYVGVKRDLTVERELRDRLEAEVRDRAATAAGLARVTGDGTVRGTAEQVVAEVRRLEGVDAAALLWLGADGAVRHRAVAAAEVLPDVPELLPAGEAELVRTRAAAMPGGWAESIEEHRAACTGECVAPADAPVTGLVHVPVRVAGDPVAVLGALTTGPGGGEWARRRLPALAEFANHTAALLGPLVDHHTRVEELRSRILGVLDTAAFTPVFQPIVDAGSHRVVGHEALTRFADGTRPDLRFLEADRVGLCEALERACALAAADRAADLPGTGFLSVNLSPAALDRDLLVELQCRARRPLVVELTEHVAVEDYDHVRSVIDGLRPRVRLAVDDAGAGYASLRHVLELRPDVVKLDLGLVRGIHLDPARQAIAAGIVHYASVTGTQVIAEGVETREESVELERLGIPLLQGYLWGHPAPLRPHPAAAATASRAEPEVGVEPTT